VAGCAIAGDVLTCNRAGLDPGDGFSVHVRSSTTYSTECRTYDSRASVTSTNAGQSDAGASVLVEGCPNLTPMVPLGLLTAPAALGTLDVASAVLGNHVTQGGTPNDPTLGPAVPAVGSGRGALPVTGVDPRPLGILALLLLLAGGVLRRATRRQEG
jgi:hypothetical protein